MLKNICVYCGSNAGHNQLYKDTAIELGQKLAQQARCLIYGGGNQGLMGAIADSALSSGGEVIGVIPDHLVVAETAHIGLTRLEIVNNMQERKSRLIELADGFIVLPGGTGTLEELYETWTGVQVGYYQKPIAIFNVNNYYQPMQHFLQHAVNEGFINENFYNSLIVESSLSKLIQRIDSYKPTHLEQWLKV